MTPIAPLQPLSSPLSAASVRSPWRPHSLPLLLVLMAAALPAGALPYGHGAGTAQSDTRGGDNGGGGPVQLGNSGAAPAATGTGIGNAGGNNNNGSAAERQEVRRSLDADAMLRRAPLSDFERFVQLAAGTPLGEPVRRFGSELMTPGAAADLDLVGQGQIPPDYRLGIGDEVRLSLWGTVEADLRLTVDRSGRITIPRVGPVMVAGTRYADLTPLIEQRVGQVFRNFNASASLGRLRGIRVYFTGFVAKPGVYTVSSLTTLVGALMNAGGPAATGSFRQIELRRGGQVVSKLDLYDFLLKGDRSADAALQADDVIHISPVGTEVGLIGSLNRPAIFELRTGETLDDALRMAGGFTAVADRSRVSIEHLSARQGERVAELALPAALPTPLQTGDIVRAFSAVEAALPLLRQNKRVRVEGEVAKPGEYVLPPDSTLADALRAAGGLTPGAYVFGTELNRESVRLTQQENYDRALRDMEIELTRNASTRRAATADEAATSLAQGQASSRLVDRLRTVRPTGRIVLQLTPDATALPPLPLETADRVYVPPRPSSVGVFGSVFNAGSYLYTNGSSIEGVLRLAGGPTRGADTGSAFVIRANGSVVSARQGGGFWSLSDGSQLLLAGPALPGDTIFVPESADKTSFLQEAKDWTQILYQFGLGAAALKTIKN